MTTICVQCNIEKTDDEYYQNYKTKCKQCIEKNRKLKRSEKYNKKKNLDIMILCLKCNIEKSAKDFYSSNQHTCKECVRQKTQERQELNLKKKEKRAPKKKEKKEVNKAVENTGNKVKALLKQIKKETSVTEYLGCDKQHFKRWLEFQFDSKMTWTNYGSYWQIDHVVGSVNFGTDEESLKNCFNWQNIRPVAKTTSTSLEQEAYTEDVHLEILNRFKQIFMNN